MYGHLCENTNGEICIQEIVRKVVDGFAVPSRLHPVNLDTIGQFTTVNDVNDKPAYKGDIVMAFFGKKSFPYQIVFHDGCFRLADDDGRLWHNIDDLPFEIIGNIFDNKDLLED